MTTLGKLARAFQLQHYYTAGTGALQLCLCHCLQHACCGDGTIGLPFRRDTALSRTQVRSVLLCCHTSCRKRLAPVLELSGGRFHIRERLLIAVVVRSASVQAVKISLDAVKHFPMHQKRPVYHVSPDSHDQHICVDHLGLCYLPSSLGPPPVPETLRVLLHLQ